MEIRKARKSDIPFIVNAIIDIENFEGTNTFNNLFGTDTETSKNYLEAFLEDEENLGNEFSLNTYYIVEVDGENAACCSLFYTDSDYYQSKSELFPIHLQKNHLKVFFENVKNLPDNKKTLTNKHFIEYLYVHQSFRNQGISKPLIENIVSKTDRLYLLALANNTFAIEYYLRLGFVLNEEINSFPIDWENSIYPHNIKVMLYKNNVKEN